MQLRMNLVEDSENFETGAHSSGDPEKRDFSCLTDYLPSCCCIHLSARCLHGGPR